MTGFQRAVNTQPAPAVEGDFASANPYASMLAGPGALHAIAAGVTLGRFARARNSDGEVSNASYGTAYRVGFAQRAQPSIITAWLGESSMLLPGGLEITLHNSGDFWCRFAGGAAIGNKVYAYYADGKAYAAATATPPAGLSVTASETSNVLTVTVADVSGDLLLPGMIIAGGSITAGTKIIAQLTGTTGGVGTYSTTTSADQASGTVTSNIAEETNWYVQSTAAAGELAMISTRP